MRNAHRATRAPWAGLGAAAMAALIALGLGAPSARAQATFTIDLQAISAVSVTTNDDWSPVILDATGPVEPGTKMISYFQESSWAEFPFTVTEAGVYTASAAYGTPNPVAPDNGTGVAITLDVRKAGTQIHYGTADIPLAPTTPGTDEDPYGLTGSFSAAGIPLSPGDYVLRVRNVSMMHTTADNRAPGFQYRAEIGYGPANRSVNIGPIKFTSTGALPATGTISGKISASDLGYGVGGAYVMAVPAGQEVAEPGPFWTAGYWTVTNPDGTYSLTVPANTALTVEAGRPDAYPVAGVKSGSVTVGSGATVTTNLSMASRWTATNGTGRLQVESEYFFNKIEDPLPDVLANSPMKTSTNMDIQCDGNASNNYKVSWTGIGDYSDVYVDIPTGQGGLYDLSKKYFCGSALGGTITFIANPGATDENQTSSECPNSGNPGDPNSGYYTSKTILFPGTISLHAGRNVIRELVESGGGVDYDVFFLEKHADIPSGPGIANPVDANAVFAIGEKGSGTVGMPSKVGNTITDFYRGDWVEIPMTFDATGIYKAVISTASNAPAPLIQLDLRPAGSDDHYATGDVVLPASTSFAATTINDIPVLQTGAYILRVRNVTQFHTTVETRASFNAYGDNGFIPNGLDFGQIVFTKTAALPATGVLSGTVKAGDIGNMGVAEAIVMANPVGAGIPEPSTLWQKGFWTTTGAGGTYSMTVLSRAYDVQAGQAAMYAFTGGKASATVGATGTADINLPSRVTQDDAGHYELNAETEYLTGKTPDTVGGTADTIIAFQQNGNAHNQIQMGYTRPGLSYIDVPVDVPVGAAGEYTVTDYYFNGYWDGTSRPDGRVSFTANIGTPDENTVEDLQPNTAPEGQNPNVGYNTPGTKVFANKLRLIEGHNSIRIKLLEGSSNFDAFTLTSSATFPLRPSGLRALRIAAGLQAGPAAGPAFTALDVVTDGSINVADAVKLIQQGKM